MTFWRGLLTVMMVLAATFSTSATATPAELEQLHREWRTFQKGPVRDGALDFSQAAMTAQAAGLKQLQARVTAIDTTGWTIADKVDLNVVRAEMNGLDFDLRVARPWQRDPAWYVSIWSAQSDTPAHEGPVHPMPVDLWTYQFPLDAASAAKLRGELGHIPPLLASAPRHLTGNARDLWQASRRNIEGQKRDLVELSTKIGDADPSLKKAIVDAIAATDTFAAWVTAEAPGKTGPSGVGKANYSWFLRNVQLSSLTWEDEVAILQRELGRAHAALRLEEHRNRALPKLAGARNAVEFDAMQKANVEKFVAFLGDREILTVEDYMIPALMAQTGSFRPPAEQDFFQIVRTRAPMTLFTHFYHWFDLAREARRPHASSIRRDPLLYNVWLSRAEGQATAFEEAMLNAGLFDDDPRARELVWIMQAQRAARGLASLYAQANMLDLAAAMKMQVERTPNGFMSADLPLLAFEQQTYLRLPGYGPSYITGKAAIERLMGEVAEKRGADFRIKDFYDEMNTYGMIPVSLIRWQWLGATDEATTIGLRQ